MSDPPSVQKKKGLLSVFSGLRKRSKSREPPTLSTQGGSVPIRTSDGHTDGPPGSLEDGQLHGVGQRQGPPLSPHKSPTILVEDRSVHNYGSTYNNSHSVHGTANYIGNVTNAALGANSVTTIERAFFSHGNEAALLWDSLPKQRDMSGQQNEYLEGSREDTVQYALTWGEDPKSELALFIHGPAGVGKSTLARHLTHRLHAAGRLAASVSLSGVPTDARGPESVVKLIAREIGEKHPDAIPAILEAIRLCKGAPLEDHFDRFLKDVVCYLKLSHPLTVLFDAVDEWESYSTLLGALPRLSSSASSLRFILLGRLDPRVRGFYDVSIHLYPLHPVSRGIMERYFGCQFNDVRWDGGRRPSLSQTIQLAELSHGLFIWASIVCSLLKKKFSRSSPNQTLEAILDLQRSLGENENLAGLYRQALAWLFPDSDAQELAQSYLGATLVLQEPLPITDFSYITNLPARVTEEIQGALTALQIRRPLGDEGSHLVHPADSVFHRSLLEYLQSKSEFPNSVIPFHLSAFDAHSHLAEICLTKFPQLLPSSRNITAVHLSPREQYIVKYLATHIYKGTPSVKPGSCTEWLQTRHHHLLQQLGIAQLHHWGSLLLNLVKPGSLMKEGEYADDEAGGLMHDIAALLKSDSALRSLQIACLELAVRLQPEDAGIWDGLGWAYHQPAEYSKDIDAGDRAILAHQNALDIVEQSGRSDRAYALYSLATSLHTRFQLIGNSQNLNRSVSLHREALALRPPGHAGRAQSLGNLAISLRSSSELGDSINNIDEIIHLEREALDLCPPGHRSRSLCLRNLACTLHSRFQITTSIADLNEDILLSREVLKLCPPGHAARVAALHDLAVSLQSRSSVMPASTADLDETIRLHREVLELRPPGHADRVAALQSLAASLRSRSETIAFAADLDEEVLLHRELLELHPPGHAARVGALRSLAFSLHCRFQTTSSIADLDEDILLSRKVVAVELCPPGHAEHVAALRSLAYSLQSRFETTASVADIEESISLGREALEHCLPGHTDRAMSLNSLAWSLAFRYETQGLIQDLEESVSLGRESLALLPTGHPDRYNTLDTLAKALHFKPEHLDEALQLSRESVSLILPGNDQDWDLRMTLATILLRKHKSSGSVEELREAVSTCEEALSECTRNHSLRPKLLDLQAKSSSPSQP